MILFEIKAAENHSDVFGRNNRGTRYSQSCRAALQLMAHFSRFCDELNLRQGRFESQEWKELSKHDDWIKLCAVFPFYDGDVFDDDVRLLWKKAREAIYFAHSAYPHQHGKAYIIRPENVIFKSKRDLELDECWLEHMLGLHHGPSISASDDTPSITRDYLRKLWTEAYMEITCWCLLGTFGTILRLRSKKSDEENPEYSKGSSTGILDTDLCQITSTNTAHLQQPTLLTAEQNYILTNMAPTTDKPVLILGSSGTGKTFLLLEKIKQLQECGLLRQDARAIIFVDKNQICLFSWLKKETAPFGDRVDICRVNPDQEGRLEGLADLIEEQTKSSSVKYVFVDQLEDLINERTNIDRELTLLQETLQKRKCVILMWVLWNSQMCMQQITYPIKGFWSSPYAYRRLSFELMGKWSKAGPKLHGTGVLKDYA